MVQRTRVFIAAFLAVISVGFALLGMEAGAANSQGACFLDQLVGLPCECNKVLGTQYYCYKAPDECSRFQTSTSCNAGYYYGVCNNEPGNVLGSGTQNLLLGDIACTGEFQQVRCIWDDNANPKCQIKTGAPEWKDCPGFYKEQVSCS